MKKIVKKIKLSELKVQSFITSNNLRSVISGQAVKLTGHGSDVDPTGDSGSISFATNCYSIQYCVE